MVQRRKVANLLGLAVLSTLYERPMHRYEMASVMRSRGKEQDMRIKWGSLYTVVDSLAKHGLVEVIGSDRQGSRPERTIYRITDAGREELADWTRELIAEPDLERPRFVAGLSVLVVLPPDEVATLLRQRLERLEATMASQRQAVDLVGPEVPRLFLIETDYELAMARAEADWVERLISQLEDGSYPDVAGWRAWHQSGVPPEDFPGSAQDGTSTR